MGVLVQRAGESSEEGGVAEGFPGEVPARVGREGGKGNAPRFALELGRHRVPDLKTHWRESTPSPRPHPNPPRVHITVADETDGALRSRNRSTFELCDNERFTRFL